MAMIDYGAILFINGVQQNHKMFMDMQEAVGWNDGNKPESVNGNFFVYAGDEHLTVAVFRRTMGVLLDRVTVEGYWMLADVLHDRSPNRYEDAIRKRATQFDVDGVHFHLEQIGTAQLWLKFSYGGNWYNIIYGYGIDPDEKVWSRVKDEYMDKKTWQKIDRIVAQIKKMGE